MCNSLNHIDAKIHASPHVSIPEPWKHFTAGFQHLSKANCQVPASAYTDDVTSTMGHSLLITRSGVCLPFLNVFKKRKTKAPCLNYQSHLKMLTSIKISPRIKTKHFYIYQNTCSPSMSVGSSKYLVLAIMKEPRG